MHKRKRSRFTIETRIQFSMTRTEIRTIRLNDAVLAVRTDVVGMRSSRRVIAVIRSNTYANSIQVAFEVCVEGEMYFRHLVEFSRIFHAHSPVPLALITARTRSIARTTRRRRTRITFTAVDCVEAMVITTTDGHTASRAGNKSEAHLSH